MQSSGGTDYYLPTKNYEIMATRKNLLNPQKLEDRFREIYTDAVSGWEIPEDLKESMVDEIDAAACASKDLCLQQFEEYAFKADTSIVGNFADIRLDYKREKPLGEMSYDRFLELWTQDLISPETEEKFQTWAQSWFFTAFGTWGFSYNFQNGVSEMLYWYEKEEEEYAYA